jgi:hypothetical protein
VSLDVYVGPLSRYYSFSWDVAAVEQLRRVMADADICVARGPFDPATPEEAHRHVLAWREKLGQGLGLKLDWDESPDGEYLTWQLGRDGHTALSFLACDDEFPELPLPDLVPWGPDPDDPSREIPEPGFSRAYADQLAQAMEHRYRPPSGPPGERLYWHILLARIWLPAGFRVLVKGGGGLPGEPMVGSVPEVRVELERLNERTLAVNARTLRRIRDAGPPLGIPFEGWSRYGLAVMLLQAREADARHLPMVLHDE